MHLEDIIVPTTLFIASALVLLKYLDGRHRERMTMIEKGIVELPKAQAPNGTKLLTIGLLAIFVSIGMLLATWMHYDMGMKEEAIPGIMILFGGVGLVAAYTVAKKRREEEQRV